MRTHTQSSSRNHTTAVSRWPRGTLMANLAADDRETLIGLGRDVAYGVGEALIREGGPETTALLITSGCVKVFGGAEDGATVLLALRVQGDLVGEISALDGQPRSATVVAVRPTVTRVLTAAAFRSFLRESPTAAEVVQRSVAGKLRGATRHRIDSSSGTAAVRLARTLDSLVRSYARAVPEGLRIDVPLSHADLAALAGISDASVQRALRSLRAAGAVATKYRGVIVREPGILRAIAGQSGWPATEENLLPGVPTPRGPRPPRPKRPPLEPRPPRAEPATGPYSAPLTAHGPAPAPAAPPDEDGTLSETG
ncbi:Crp/Fnr family transcriptional regulator [Streptomyces sp. NPDC041003]|uniref:Crp/Fnr family transcriptional regulator n=1 Tax=Streptomyces sp. NPDC041003 TaxID=3155730 RepID=UPI00340CBB63